jgi:hypothetical protein
MERAVREDLQPIRRNIEVPGQEVFLGRRWNEKAIGQVNSLLDHLLPEPKLSLHLLVALPGFSRHAGQARRRRKRLGTEYLITTKAVSPGTNHRQIVQGHDGRTPHLATEGDEIRGEAHPVLDVDDLRPEGIEIAADVIFYLGIIRRKPASRLSAKAGYAGHRYALFFSASDW